jgi:metal-responsive CopG/Arc/MetJ family transcriptional regulator
MKKASQDIRKISLQLPQRLLDTVDEWRSDKEMSRSDAVSLLIDHGITLRGLIDENAEKSRLLPTRAQSG